MEKDYFFSFDQLLKNITNRKEQQVTSTVNNKVVKEKEKVEWLKMQWLQFKESEPLTMYYKYSNNVEVHFSKVNLKKRKTSDVGPLDLLYPRGRKIDEKKKQDLLSLLDYIPPIKHGFYTNILSSSCLPATVPVDSEVNSEDEERLDEEERLADGERLGDEELEETA